MSNYKRQQNGAKGEDRTRSYIPNGFWLLTRSVDADAADLIVQEAPESEQEVIENRHDSPRLGYVQAKFFEGNNQVKIDRMYVEDLNSEFRKGFFAFLHTDDSQEKQVHYFFTAKEIKDNWKITEDGDYFYFSLTKERDYKEFRNLEAPNIREKLLEGISSLSFAVMQNLAQRFSAIYSSRRSSGTERVQYIFCRPHDSWTVICKVGSNNSHPLEPQKDAYLSFGTFQWGYRDGEGPRLLSASLLTHFLCGRRPRLSEIKNVAEFLLEMLPTDPEQETIVTGDQVINALAGFPFDSATQLEGPIGTLLANGRQKYAEFIPRRTKSNDVATRDVSGG